MEVQDVVKSAPDRRLFLELFAFHAPVGTNFCNHNVLASDDARWDPEEHQNVQNSSNFQGDFLDEKSHRNFLSLKEKLCWLQLSGFLDDDKNIYKQIKWKKKCQRRMEWHEWNAGNIDKYFCSFLVELNEAANLSLEVKVHERDKSGNNREANRSDEKRAIWLVSRWKTVYVQLEETCSYRHKSEDEHCVCSRQNVLKWEAHYQQEERGRH